MNDRSPPAADLEALRLFARQVAAVLRTAQLHSAGSPTFAAQVDRLRTLATRLIHRHGPLRLTSEGGVRVNDLPLQEPGLGESAEPDLLTPLLARRRFVGVEFRRAPGPGELRAFLEVWRTWRASGREPSAVNEELRRTGVRGLRFLVTNADPSADLSTADEELDAYCALLAVAESLADPLVADDPGEARKREAALEAALVCVARSPRGMLPLTANRDATRYEAVHAANTAVLSMLLARRLGLGYEAILDVGRGALHADVGMYRIVQARDIRGGLDRAASSRVMKHPVDSFLSALRGTSLDPAGRARAIVAYEHHMGPEGAGYPARAGSAGPHIFSRIVAIADGYDALVHDRGDREGLARPLALEALAELSGQRYDTQLLRSFADMLGRFPPGSVLTLSTGEIAVAIRPATDPRLFDRPAVYRIRDRSGAPLAAPRFLDLANERGESATTVTGVLQDRLFPVNLIPMLYSA